MINVGDKVRLKNLLPWETKDTLEGIGEGSEGVVISKDDFQGHHEFRFGVKFEVHEREGIVEHTLYFDEPNLEVIG